MLTVPEDRIRGQLSETVKVISSYDFPENWENLLKVIFFICSFYGGGRGIREVKERFFFEKGREQGGGRTGGRGLRVKKNSVDTQQAKQPPPP